MPREPNRTCHGRAEAGRIVSHRSAGLQDPEPLSEICLALAADEIETVRASLREQAITPEHGKHWLRFDDPFGFRWTLQEPHIVFKSSGEIAERWLAI